MYINNFGDVITTAEIIDWQVAPCSSGVTRLFDFTGLKYVPWPASF